MDARPIPLASKDTRSDALQYGSARAMLARALRASVKSGYPFGFGLGDVAGDLDDQLRAAPRSPKCNWVVVMPAGRGAHARHIANPVGCGPANSGMSFARVAE